MNANICSSERYEELGRLVQALKVAEIERRRAVVKAAGMTGSDKQIAWAVQIRAKYQTHRERMVTLCDDPRMAPADAARARAMFAAFDGYTRASQWIDVRHDIHGLCAAADRT